VRPQDRLLRGPHGERRLGGDPGGQRERLVERRIGGDDLRDEAGRLGFRAGIVRPVRISSIAFALPIARVSRCVPPAPGMTPSLISGWPNWASSPATIMSQLIASSQPPPRAKPRTAAIVGVRTAPIRSQTANRFSDVSVIGVWIASSLMSAPAANARVPAPVRTMTRHASSASSRSSSSAERVEEVEAERVQRFLRSIVTSATPSTEPDAPTAGRRR
jgi:hypothetical protein